MIYKLRTFRNIISALALFASFLILSLLPAVAKAEAYDVNMSWFIDMQQFTSSAHGNIHCVQCHKDLGIKDDHPTPSNVTKASEDFFDKKHCAGTDCHDNTLQEFEKGKHGRISFNNHEKYGFCIDCHDPHLTPINPQKKAPQTAPKGRDLCKYEDGVLTDPNTECSQDEDCLNCHREINEDQKLSVLREANLCFKCHDKNSEIHRVTQKPLIPPIEAAEYRQTGHTDIRCTECHSKSASYQHQKKVVSCKDCHHPHDEGMTHDSHARISCEACHLRGKAEVSSLKDGKIVWEKHKRDKLAKVTVHDLLLKEKEANCRRCHVTGNKIGASSMLLPAKSVICITCHAATFSVDDPITLITLLGFLLVLTGLFTVWSSGTANWPGSIRTIPRFIKFTKIIGSILFSAKIFEIGKFVLLDAVIQRKLFRQSFIRWLSHSLILFGFLVRMVWGLFALIISLVAPKWAPVWAMLDKNTPLVAFLYDFTGLMIIVGVVMILVRKATIKQKKWAGLPKQEWFSLSLIGSIILVGFILEGMRIAMTIDIPGKSFAFIGTAISFLFNNSQNLNDLYGYVWYLHAIFTGAFIIWFPFSRMFHIVMAPLAIAINTVWHHEGVGRPLDEKVKEES